MGCSMKLRAHKGKSRWRANGGGSCSQNCWGAVSREAVEDADMYCQIVSAGSKVPDGLRLY